MASSCQAGEGALDREVAEVSTPACFPFLTSFFPFRSSPCWFLTGNWRSGAQGSNLMLEAWSPAIVESHKNIPNPLNHGQKGAAIYKGFAQPFISHTNIKPSSKFQAILLIGNLEKKRKKCYVITASRSTKQPLVRYSNIYRLSALIWLSVSSSANFTLLNRKCNRFCGCPTPYSFRPPPSSHAAGGR